MQLENFEAGVKDWFFIRKLWQRDGLQAAHAGLDSFFQEIDEGSSCAEQIKGESALFDLHSHPHFTGFDHAVLATIRRDSLLAAACLVQQRTHKLTAYEVGTEGDRLLGVPELLSQAERRSKSITSQRIKNQADFDAGLTKSLRRPIASSTQAELQLQRIFFCTQQERRDFSVNKFKEKISLAYLRGPDQTKNLVLVRNYGALASVMVDEIGKPDDTTFRIPSKFISEFLEPVTDGLVIDDLANQYDELQLYITSQDLACLGPLASARAAFALKNGADPASAIELASKEGSEMVEQLAKRAALVDSLLAAKPPGG